MHFTTSAVVAFAAIVGRSSAQDGSDELPFTETDVFIQSGEVSESSIVIMARCNSEVDSTVLLSINGEAVQEQQVSSERDYTVSFFVEGLDSNTSYEYSAQCNDGSTTLSSMQGAFQTAPGPDDEVALNFVWCADLAGQGWGRNPDFSITTVDGRTVTGGYVVFDTMESLSPDFALFQGDMIYADNAIAPVQAMPGGGNWTNNPSLNFIAVTLEEFRDNWKYNHGDEKMQSFLAKTPIFVQWDDHEVTNNWWPDEIVGLPSYPNNTAVNTLYENSLQAFYEFNPIEEGKPLYRKQRFGKHVEIFFPDYRSYRDPNTANADEAGATMLGAEQLQWLKDSLLESTATWKIISSHDPFGIVTGGEGDWDSFGQEMPEILGRELELQEILSFIHDNNINNIVSLTSDVHFTAHVNMHPDRAESGFTAFKPLDEFVIGPIHAGSFGPNFMDTSFGARYEYELGPLTLGFERWANLPPAEFRLQSFGHVAVSADGVLEIKLIGIDGDIKLEKTLTPEASGPPTTAPPTETPPTGTSPSDSSSGATSKNVKAFVSASVMAILLMLL